MEINKLLKELIELTCTENTSALQAKNQEIIEALKAKVLDAGFQAEYPIFRLVLSALNDRHLEYLKGLRNAIKPDLPDTPCGLHVGLPVWTVN